MELVIILVSKFLKLQPKKLQLFLLLSCLLWFMVLLLSCNGTKKTTPLLGEASKSSPIALSVDGNSVWIVNPDANSVSELAIETQELVRVFEVGEEPWAVALSPQAVVVMNRASGSLSILEQSIRTDIFVGAELGGLALSPTGHLAYVTVSSSDELAVVDLLAKSVLDRVSLGRLPWSVAVTNDGDEDDSDEQIIVSHKNARLKQGGFQAQNEGSEAWVSVLNASDLSITEHIISDYAFGFANILEGLAVQGKNVWLTHLLNSPELPRDFETTVSAGLSQISLEPSESKVNKLHLNAAEFSTPINFPRALAVTKDQTRAYLVLSGTDALMGIDFSRPSAKLIGFWPLGANPRGIVLSEDETKAYVMNYLSRDLSIVDLSNENQRLELARVKLVSETLSAEVLRGKVLFNNASDPRLSHLGWISCASCHPDGGTDNTTWVTPEGHRNTSPLWVLKDTAPYHASASRDELQDFEHDIETLMGGVGLAPQKVNALLLQPNTNTSADLDALASYLNEGIRVPKSTFNQNGLKEGEEVFIRSGCHSCHSGKNWTNSQLSGELGTLAPEPSCFDLCSIQTGLHDVGSFNQSTDILGQDGFDIPTLLGLR